MCVVDVRCVGTGVAEEGVWKGVCMCCGLTWMLRCQPASVVGASCIGML